MTIEGYKALLTTAELSSSVSLERVFKATINILGDFSKASDKRPWRDLVGPLSDVLHRLPKAIFNNGRPEAVDLALVFNTAAHILTVGGFIEWKNVQNFDADSIRISRDFILPFNTLLRTSCAQSVDNKQERQEKFRNASKKILYLPNVSPFRTGIANADSAWGIIESFDRYLLESSDDSYMVVCVNKSSNNVQRPEITSRIARLKSARIHIVEYSALKTVDGLAQRLGVNLLMIDYFAQPYSLLPLFKNLRLPTIYMSMGYVPAIFDFVDRICTIHPVSDEMLGFITENSDATVVCPGRAEIQNLNRTRSPSQYEIDLINKVYGEDRVLTFGTLCRSSKVSKVFMDAVSRILTLNSNSYFIIAGNLVDEIVLDNLVADAVIRDRIRLLPNMSPSLLFEKIDVYLETFPEHQGMAVLDAMNFGIPVIYINNEEYVNVNLSERAPYGECKNVNEYIEKSTRMAVEEQVRRECVSEQFELQKGIYPSPKEYWEKVFG